MRKVFRLCREEIRTLLDYSALNESFKKCGIVMDSQDEEDLSNVLLQDPFVPLIDLVERQGEDGFLLLYVCIHKSGIDFDVPDHIVAIKRLDAMGKQVRSWILK